MITVRYLILLLPLYLAPYENYNEEHNYVIFLDHYLPTLYVT